MLTVHQISELQLKQAKIAYLSACSTTENRAQRLRDEVIHIVSGFQVAGFAHVIGCLWPSADATCVEIGRGFYESLFETRQAEIEDRVVAIALQRSVEAVLAAYWDQPLKWAQFVHFGA